MNWSRSARALIAMSLLTQVSLYSWSMGKEHPAAAPASPQNFPFSQNQQWFMEESYLLWKPYMENMWYGNKDTFKQIDANHVSDRIKIKNPEFDWSSGVRVTIGRYLPNHDLWDIGFTTTYYYTDTNDKVRADTLDNVGFNPSFFTSHAEPTDKGRFNWRLNYWTLDLLIGRLFNMTSNIVFHPYFGVRGSLQYQHARERTSLLQNAPNGFTLTNQKSSIDNDFWGVGPRVGTSFIYYFKNHFSFLANISAALLVGGQKLKNNSFFNQLVDNTGIFTETDIDTKSDDSLNVIRSNVEASLGIGWERWLSNNTVRIAPSINFEGSLWFAMNQLYNINPQIDSGTNIEQRRHGNLGLMGLSFNLQVDF
jgi:hypothetical protein